MKEREQILADMRRQLEEIRDMYATAEHWNEHVRKPGEPLINPDPKGDLEAIEHSLIETLTNDKGHGRIEYKAPRLREENP